MKASLGALAASITFNGLASAIPPPELSQDEINRATLDKLGYSNVTYVRGYPPNGVFELPDPVYPDQSVVQRWETNEECADSYFAIDNEDNRIDSAWPTFYWTSIQSLAKSNATEYESKGEYSIWHQKFYHESWAFKCDIHHDGCSKRYTCADTVKATRNRNPDMDTPELLELSRKIYFSHDRLWYLGLNYKNAYVRITLP
jgi:hypothetical protein